MLDSTWLQWLADHSLFRGDGMTLLLALIAALCIGLSKAGLAGTATLNVVLMAKAFGAKESVGVVLPLLIVADFMGFMINRKGGSWRPVWLMAVPAMIGVAVGAWLFDIIDKDAARTVIGWLIIGLLAFKVVLDTWHSTFVKLTEHRVFAWTMGCMAGLVTMLANAAGPVMTVYLLSQRLEKKEWLGVFSRFFLFINLFKVPFSQNLGIINTPSLMTNLILLPAVIAGILIGWQVLKRIPQKPFEWLLFGLTLVAAVWLVVG
jgi:uncharacterized membrane protein YfcA